MKKLVCVLLTLLLLTGVFCHGAYCSAGESIMSYARRNFSEALRYCGRINFDGYCGACVSYQLLTGGITSSLNNFNGNQSYAYFAYRNSTGTGYTVKAYPSSVYSLRNVLEAINLTPGTGLVTPVLLGFNKGTASNAGQTYGHTMLIYAVSDGNVYYADSMYPTVEESVRVQTIDEFCAHYSDQPETPRREFVFDGAILFCNYAPYSLKLSAGKAVYAAGEQIRLNLSAVGASKYFVGIDKDGKRVSTVSTKGDCTLNLAEPGIYSAYFTAVNPFGAADSMRVEFELINQAPCNQKIEAAKQIVKANEPVYLSFDADYATAYFLGVTYPDGAFSAIDTNGANAYTLTFPEKGTYSVYATCVNVFGYVDTDYVAIEVK